MAAPLSPSAFAAISAIAVLAYLCYCAALPRPISGVPYNKKSAQRLLGDAPDVLKHVNTHGDIYAYFPKLMTQLNEPIIQLFMLPFGRPWVIVSDPREASDIMIRRTKEFDRSSFIGQLFNVLLPKNQAALPTGDEWLAHRRLTGDVMTPTCLHRVAGPQMWSTASKLVDPWREKARLAKGRPFRGETDVHNTLLDIIWAGTFGGEIGPNEARVKNLASIQGLDVPTDIDRPVDFPEIEDPPAFTAIELLVKSMEIPASSPFPTLAHWLAVTFRRDLFSARKAKNALIRRKLREASEKLSQRRSEEDVKSALELVLAKEIKLAEKEGRPADLESQAVQDELFGFLIGGSDTTTSTMLWGLKYLTENQQVQSKLRGFLRDSFPEGRMPTIEDITNTSIPYLDAVINEILRASKINPPNVRKVLRDTQVLGYHIPKGTDVFLISNGPGYVMDPLPIDENKRSQTSQANRGKTRLWGDDRATFRPERWLDENGMFDPDAGPMHAFGAGQRSCLGRRWALLELQVLIVCIIWNFELLPTPPSLSSWRAKDALTHCPVDCFVRLKAL